MARATRPEQIGWPIVRLTDDRPTPGAPAVPPPSWPGARALAADWHAGQSSALYAFTSSGAILPGLLDELDNAAAECEDPGEAGTLTATADHLRTILADPRAMRVETARGPHDAGTLRPVAIGSPDTGGRWYAITLVWSFDPPVYVVAASDEMDALEAFADLFGHRSAAVVTSPDLGDYDDDDDRLIWTDAGPLDGESIDVRPVIVRARDLDRCETCKGTGSLRPAYVETFGAGRAYWAPRLACHDCAGEGLAYVAD